MKRFPKYSSLPSTDPMLAEPTGGLLPKPFVSTVPIAEGDKCSLLPNADVCRSLSVSDVRASLAEWSDAEGDSRPNLDGTDAGQGPYLAASDMPLLSNDAGSGASSTERPFEFTGESPSPRRFVSSSRGEPYADAGFEL
jgi:hypothetical protein